MKKIIVFLLFITLLACSDKKEIKTTSIDSTTKINSKLVAPPKADGILVRYNFAKGDIYNYKITTLSASSQELVADSVISTKANQKVEYRVNLTVNDIDSAKTAKITIFVESIIVSGEINEQEVSYDSKYILSTRERVMFAQYEAIKNKKYIIDITNNGQILRIYNTEEMLNELLSIQQQLNSVTTEQKKELLNNFSESALLPLSEQIFRKFPSEKVAINYSWSDSYYSQFALFQIENIANFQLVDIEAKGNDSTLIFNAGLSINFVGEHTSSNQGMNFYFYDPVVSGSGTIKFNKSKGLILYSKTSTNMEMETDISGVDQNQSPVNAKRTDNTSNTNIVELIK